MSDKIMEELIDRNGNSDIRGYPAPLPQVLKRSLKVESSSPACQHITDHPPRD